VDEVTAMESGHFVQVTHAREVAQGIKQVIVKASLEIYGNDS